MTGTALIQPACGCPEAGTRTRRANPCCALLAILLGMGLWLTGCSGGSSATRVRPAVPARWVRFRHVPAVVDLTGPRTDGRLTVAAAGRLALLGPTGEPAPFARGRGGYSTAPGPEPYVALATGTPVVGAGCSFGRDAVYAIEPGTAPGVIRVDAQGQAQRLAQLPGVQPNGIAFDDVGRFGYRLLVTAAATHGATAVFAIDCRGRVSTIAANAPVMEGGIAVAPLTFGSYGGDLVAPDENTARIWALAPDGSSSLVARSPLASGGDIGVESEAFVPAGFNRDSAAFVADRRSPGNRHPGTDSILRLSGAALADGGVGPGELVVAGEGGGQTIVVSCTATCTVRHIADGPPTSHIEGHVVFAPKLGG